MKKELWELGGAKNESYLYGEKPELLILSGMHGDEYEVIGCVKEVVTKNIKRLPSFLYIPEVSPSAVGRRKRTNEEGLDINRIFFDDSKNVEVRLIFKILEGRRFHICLDFHEDPEFQDFYLYDAFGQDLEGTGILKKLKEDIRSLGLGLLNGIDDPDDPILGNVFKDGYKYFPPEKPYVNKDGRFEAWAFSKGNVKRFLNPEIPGKISLALKRKVVEIIFEDLVLGAEELLRCLKK